MLQALIHSKLGRAIKNSQFQPIEDTQTSSTVGVLQYLPSSVFWSILYDAIQGKKDLPKEIGEILVFRFWPQLSIGEDSSNSNRVEPDVLIETEQYYIIIEAKRFDEGGQSRQQWINEVGAVIECTQDNPKPILLIALGGNSSLATQKEKVGEKEFCVFPLTWLDLLHSIQEYRKKKGNALESHYDRLLSDTIEGFALHNYFDVEWLCHLSDRTIEDSKLPLGTFSFGNLSNLTDKFISKQNIDLLWKK
ncbi:hypothetical protein [Porphyromonas sp. COT-239 OH1446]|uniref:hypothetical protein n=1 Tax=Porphyromonas sp. COT-239 OH1446 TaxID=1515613 RepID=UPI00052C3598|nr:hypothetical protein [Porphyromonas sp. COT-239 OH1446]KGN68494.1 hypothetical protein HQ37_05885 [Porphyromonas sp. COT-239 OH1446]